jgi:hypothetical protein
MSGITTGRAKGGVQRLKKVKTARVPVNIPGVYDYLVNQGARNAGRSLNMLNLKMEERRMEDQRRIVKNVVEEKLLAYPKQDALYRSLMKEEKGVALTQGESASLNEVVDAISRKGCLNSKQAKKALFISLKKGIY